MTYFFGKRCLIFAVFMQLSCGSADNANRIVPENGFASDPVNYTEVSRTLLTEQNYFVSYSQTSGRLAIVDSDSFAEIWGTYTDKNVPFVFNLPGHEGAGLVSPGEFRVVIKEGSRSFTFPKSNELVWNRARNVIALAAYSSQSKTIHAVKFRGDNNFEQAEINPFPNEEPFNDAGSIVVGDNGNIILLLGAFSGSYAVIADSDGTLAHRRTCSNSGLLGGEVISGAYVDEKSDSAFVTAGSKIYRIDLGAAATCADPSIWSEIFSSTNDFKRIGRLSLDTLYSLEFGENETAKVQLFSDSGTAFTVSKTLDPGCAEPVSANAFGANYYSVLCVNRKSSSFSSVSTGAFQNASLQFLGLDGSLALTKTIEFDKKSGVVFNPEKSSFFEIFDSAAGEATVHTVPTGDSRKVEGIFIGGILNRL